MAKSKLVIKSIVVSIFGVLALSPLVGAQGNSNAGENVTICHATSSQTNPYVQNSPNKNGIVNGHGKNLDDNDIIPSFTYNDHGTTKTFPGQNWDDQGQAIYNNGCVVPAGGVGGDGGQVLGASVVAAQVVAPKGGVAAGAGGGSQASTASLVGLVVSLASVASGMTWLRRRTDS